MTNEIGENFMYYDTSKEIWDAMKKTYSNRDLDEGWKEMALKVGTKFDPDP